jgi:putative ABC transport system permease protein
MLDNEIKEQRVLGTVLPAIFLGVAAFLLQRGGVAPGGHAARADRRAQGPGLRQQCHCRALPQAGAGDRGWPGWCWGRAGQQAGRDADLGLYAEFFRFPRLRAPHGALAAGGQRGADAGHGGGRHAQRHRATVRLAPAEAMRPPAPGHYRRTLLERLGVTRACRRRCA